MGLSIEKAELELRRVKADYALLQDKTRFYEEIYQLAESAYENGQIKPSQGGFIGTIAKLIMLYKEVSDERLLVNREERLQNKKSA